MEGSSRVYDVLNHAWKKTSRVVLGGEVGELKEYEEWLKGIFQFFHSPPYGPLGGEVTSAITGKSTYVFAPFYEEGVKFAEYALLRNMKIEPLSINEIKDIESILQGWRDRWYYRAEVVLGNSNYVERSDGVYDANFVIDSYGVVNSSYVAYGPWVRNGGNHVFGSGGGPGLRFTIRSFYGVELQRALEAYFFYKASDVYYSHYVKNSREIMFSFNQNGKCCVIGNRPLPREKYYSIKASLLEQLRDELLKEKSLPSLMDLIRESGLLPDAISPDVLAGVGGREDKCNEEVIDMAFQQTTKLLLGEPFSLEELKTYLVGEGYKPPEEVTTPSGLKVPYYPAIHFSHFPDVKERIIADLEVEAAATVMLAEDEIVSLGSLRENIGRIAYVAHGAYIESSNVCRVPFSFNSRDVAYMFDATENRMAAYNPLGAPTSSYIFGSFFTTNSSFVIKGDAGEGLKRAMEVDKCSNSSDIYFSHSVDGSSEVMFSQHLRGVRYTIGNLPLDKDKYLEVKAHLLSQVVEFLKDRGRLPFSVKGMGTY